MFQSGMFVGLTCNFFRLNEMFKFSMSNCNRCLLDQLVVYYTHSFIFDACNCSSDHEIFALIWEQNCCPYNLTGFARNYFSSVCCSCPDIDKDGICTHCTSLRYSLNNDTIEVCLRKENIPTEFKLIKINNYLQKYVNADPHFFFSEEDEDIKATLNLPDWNNFSVEKKLCKTLVHFSFLVIILSVLIIFFVYSACKDYLLFSRVQKNRLCHHLMLILFFLAYALFLKFEKRY